MMQAVSGLLLSTLPALALALAPAPESWEPAPAPPPTAWARAGARGWRLCDELGRQALAARLGARPSAGSSEEEVWRKRAHQCPHEPEVLMLAAEEQLIEAGQLSWGPDVMTALEQIEDEQRTRLQRAKRWIDEAIEENERRGLAAPLEARYLRAYVQFGLGEYRSARADLERAMAEGDVERYRAERMAALLELLLGNLDEAVELAHRALAASPTDVQLGYLASRYVWALVLDRAGAPASAREELVALRRQAGHTRDRSSVEAFLPMHERLYFRALDHQASSEKANAIRLWEAYLTHPAPIDADKELARRHQAELDPPPPAIGGPMR